MGTDLPRAADGLDDHLQRLYEVGIALSTERNLTALLERIVEHSRRLSRADAGTLYLVREDHLSFEITQNDTLRTFLGGSRGKLDVPPVPLNRESVSGYAAVTGETLNIADVYAEQHRRFRSPRKYDKLTGYRTQSMLVAPLKDHENQIIGVLQLLNAIDPVSREVVPFSGEQEALIQSLASQAAVAINTVRLIEETERLRHRNELILNAAGEGVFGLDLQGRHTFVNPAAAAMLGYEVEELIGEANHPLCHHSRLGGKPYADAECPISAAYGRGVFQRVSNEVFWRRDGTAFPVEYVATPIREGDEVVGAVVVFDDITERQRVEEERRQLERQFIQSERMASVGIVAAGIVHNLKNSLMGVLGYGELLQLEHPELPHIEQIVSSAQQMGAMIEDILAKSRQKKTPEPVDLNVLLRRELDFLAADLSFKHEVEKDIRLAERVPLIQCVYTDLSQAFSNLLRNAVEAMYGRPTKRLSVSTHSDGARIATEISDTGCGIPEEALPHLFEPFYTTKDSNAEGDAPIGSGLGLYMVHRLLEPYGAEIEVESTVEAGTTFRVIIPARLSSAEGTYLM